MESLDQNQIRLKLTLLRQKHQELNSEIAALTDSSGFDQIRVQKLKKQKLLLKDEINMLESKLLPDIIA